MVSFWDTSALVPLFVQQPASRAVVSLARERRTIVYWWGSVVECWSAFARLRREGVIDRATEGRTRLHLQDFLAHCTEIAPAEEVRLRAGVLLSRHDLRAGDALQLAAALACFKSPVTGELVTLDERLREIARHEGLTPLP